MEIPKEALVCAAQHFAAALESAKAQEPVDFGRVCEECRLLTECRADWLKTAAPIFEAAGVSPNLLWTDQPLDQKAGDICGPQTRYDGNHALGRSGSYIQELCHLVEVHRLAGSGLPEL